MKKNLTDRTVKALKPAPAGTTFDVWDIGFPGFGLRVSDKGRKTFVLAARYPGSANPTRRALGLYGPLTLEGARTKARHWLKLIEGGIDPAIEEERQRAAELRKQENTFATVAVDFAASKLTKERRGEEAKRALENVFVAAWGKRPITEISDLEIQRLIEAKAKTAPVQARNLLALIKRFFRWAKARRVYGLVQNPCADLAPRDIFNEDKVVRDRELTDDELFAFVRVTGRMPYPFGSAYRLLLFSGLRLNEAVRAQWSEFDPAVVRALRQRTAGQAIDWAAVGKDRLQWAIPKERMKGRANRARAHAVPLTPEILEILESLPLFERGDYLFSTNSGRTPAWVGDKIKKKLDQRMLRTLRALARKRGDDPRKVRLAPWRNHDLRRNVRSALSRLRVQDHVAEAVLAHVRPGIAGVYDKHDYLDERREALALWSARVRMIVEPPPENVVTLKPAQTA